MAVFLSLSIMTDNFPRYRSLCRHLRSLSTHRISMQSLLAFKVYIETPGVILMDLALHVIQSFSLAAFSILPLFCTFSVLHPDRHLLSQIWEFSSIILLKNFFETLTWVSSPLFISIICRFSLFIVLFLVFYRFNILLDRVIQSSTFSSRLNSLSST